MKNIFLLFIALGILVSCDQEKTAREVVTESIKAHGGDRVYRSVVDFDFRDKHYIAAYDGGLFNLERLFEDSVNIYHDIQNNEGFIREVNGSVVELNEEWTGKYSRSVNSVIYFFRIPFVLKDPAVILTRLPDGSIKEQAYYKIEATFSEEGGGDDFDDRFVYWINKDNYEIDYMGYSYSTDGGGKRFREAFNARRVDGWLMKDYINYEPKDIGVSLDNYDTYFESGGMKELSLIENVNVEVEYLD
jgi:hypothetical protein